MYGVHQYILFMSYVYQDGMTAFYMAAANDYTDIALPLIESGCSVDIKDDVS